MQYNKYIGITLSGLLLNQSYGTVSRLAVRDGYMLKRSPQEEEQQQ